MPERTEDYRYYGCPLRASAFKETEICEYQAVFDPEKPLSSLKEAEQDHALVDISRKIVEAAKA
jgi:hypothetical protein